MKKTNQWGIVLTSLGAACWGLSGSMGQYLFTVQKMDSRWLVPVRLGLAGILLLSYGIGKYKKEVLLPWKDKKTSLFMILYGLVGVSTCQFFYFLTIQWSSAAIATILQDLAPIFILAFTCLSMRRFPKIIEIASIAAAMAGVFFLTTHGDIRSLSVPGKALIAGVISGFCVAVYNVMAPKMKGIPVIILQGWAFLSGGAFGMFGFQIWKFHYIPNLQGIFGIAFVVLVGNIFAFTLYIKGVQLIGPNRAILYSFAEPLTAAVISSTLLGSSFGIYDAIGFALIFLMLVLVSMKE